jgi:hypothetical protein
MVGNGFGQRQPAAISGAAETRAVGPLVLGPCITLVVKLASIGVIKELAMRWTWKDELIEVLIELGGKAHLYAIEKKIKERGKKTFKSSSVRYNLEAYCPTKHFRAGIAIFYHKGHERSGIYGLINKTDGISPAVVGYPQKLDIPDLRTPKAKDFTEPAEPDRISCETYRILRDTGLARKIKGLHKYKCQICGETIELPNGYRYVEVHHLKPLGSPHNGPDIAENIVCVCPNHHVRLDYGAIRLEKSMLNSHSEHLVGDEYLNYHNFEIFGVLK